uniref:Uncharacterized protein n=1 Tax=Arundo donax TaxID=35708 RepID=A0A0A9GGU4_ARUDO
MTGASVEAIWVVELLEAILIVFQKPSGTHVYIISHIRTYIELTNILYGRRC